MSYWIEHDGGLVLLAMSGGAEPQAQMGGTVAEVEALCDPAQCLYLDGEVLDLGPAPSAQHVLDVATRQWVINQTDAQKIEAVRVRLQRVMDDAARAIGYDDIKTAITYADEPAVPKFQAEGQAFRTWRSLVWAACYAHPAMAGLAPFPTPDEAQALMPALVLPESTP